MCPLRLRTCHATLTRLRHLFGSLSLSPDASTDSVLLLSLHSRRGHAVLRPASATRLVAKASLRLRAGVASTPLVCLSPL